MVTNSHFCHGASGVAQFYKTLADETQLKEYRTAYEVWIDKTLLLLGQDLKNKAFTAKETNLLEGLIGPTFVLLSDLCSNEVSWSKLLLL